MADQFWPEHFEQAFRIVSDFPGLLIERGYQSRQVSSSASRYARTLESAIPALQSRPSASYGARLHSAAAHITRSFKQRGARQGVRGAPGPAHDAKSVNSEVIGDSLDVIGGVRDPAVRKPVRARVARPVIADQADAEPVEDNSARTRAIAASWRAVKEEHRLSVRVTQALHRQPSPIRSLDLLRHSSLPARLSSAYPAATCADSSQTSHYRQRYRYHRDEASTRS